MDQRQTQNINQAMEQLVDSAQQSFQMLADRTVRVQERNLMITQTSFQNWIEQVHNRAQATQEVTHRTSRSRASASGRPSRRSLRKQPTSTLSSLTRRCRSTRRR